MVRTYTFAAMVVVAYAALKGTDKFHIWMAKHRDKQLEKYNLASEVRRAKRQIVQELQEKGLNGMDIIQS